MSSQQSNSTTLTLTPQQRALLDRAAKQQGMRLADFVREAACREAETVLLDQADFAVEGAAFDRFRALLDSPPEPSDALRRLMHSKAPW